MPPQLTTSQPDSHPEKLSGLIERVTFFNEENGFSVLQVQVKGRSGLVTVLGNLPSVNAGEWLTAEGQWTQNKDHGLQFRATQLASAAPTTREGIEKYLGSGLVKGIGPSYAKKMVAHFGDKIIDIIDHQSARLEEVEGIGPMRRRKIKVAWTEQKAVRDIMVFLHSNGVSSSRAVRIYKTYGDASIDTIRSNPYVLARDIPGIGFKTADQIAQKSGVPTESLQRAAAGLDHVLLQATDHGHCALPVDVLLKNTTELLQVNESIVTQALDQAVASKDLIRESIGGELLVMPPHLKKAEEGIASALRRLASAASAYPEIDVPKATTWWEQKSGKELAPSQKQALAQAVNSRVLVITGGPGVGKTTLLHAILSILHAKKVRCLLCAPTGRAAKRLGEATGMEARTIHRLLEAQPGLGFTRNASNPLSCDLLVMDEASMVDVPLMNHLLQAIPPGASLLIVGDIDQLPSVGPGMVLKNIIDSGMVPVVCLTEVFRQAAHSHIITNAHRINQGLAPETAPKNSESDFYIIERNDPAAITQTLLDMVKNRIPAKFGLDPVQDVQVLCPMNRGSLGVREMNLRLQASLNPLNADVPYVEKFGWQFRPGDKVIQTVNNYDKDVFNGDIGRVLRIDPTEQQLTVQMDQREVLYEYGELDELSLAYAITIHKSQGSEFPAVVIPLSMQHYLLLQRNLIYTGITRGRKLVLLIGENKALSMAIRNNQTRRRYTGLLNHIKMYRTKA